MTIPLVLTRQSREEELEQKGVTGAALECLLAETTQERHRSRVAYARWVAEEYYLNVAKLDRDEVTHDTLTLMAGAILWADVIGIGGRDGVEGAATARHPAFTGCGKGRKQAMDGGAWSAAIFKAARMCGGRFRVVDVATADGDTVVGRSILLYVIEDGGDVSVDDTLAPAPWVYSILREGLRRAAGLRSLPPDREYVTRFGWHSEVPFDAPPESLAGWAKLVNEATPVEPQVPVTASVSDRY